jgi:peptidoglycan/LPS O-acetylase OafA/YrhL
MWTLRFEFLMYLMVLALGALRLLRLPVMLGLLALGMACLQFAALRWLGGWGWLLGFFVVGMVLYRLRATRIYDGRVAIIALAGLVLSVPIGQFIPLFPLFGCYLALWLALNPRLPVIPAARFGDLSYGIYIYGWPVEATAIWLLGGHAAWWQVFLLALPVTAVLAFLSWHLIERPALSFKPIGRRTIGRSPSAWPQARREGRHRALLHRQLPGQNAAKVKHDPKGSKGAKEENADRVGSPSAFSETSPMSAPQLADRVDFANT